MLLTRRLQSNLEVRYWPKADPIFHKIDQFGTSAFRPKAAVRLSLVKRAANDPYRTFPDAGTPGRSDWGTAGWQ
jgi:hypothetical protein